MEKTNNENEVEEIQSVDLGNNDHTDADNNDLLNEEGYQTNSNSSYKNEPTKEELLLKRSATYVKKSDKYQDLKSTASTFLVFGIGGIIFVILNIFGVFSTINNGLSYTIMTLMFIGFIYIGITSFMSSKKIKNEIGGEEQLTAQINDWLKTNITSSVLNSVKDESLSDEVNYFRELEYMKERLNEQFDGLDDSYLDQVIEDYISENIKEE